MTPLFLFTLALLGAGAFIGHELGDAVAGFLVALALLALLIYKVGDGDKPRAVELDEEQPK